ncbi:MAG TPA: hypothetical protein VFF04_02975 [Candidatus Babeliales bacterium]|nr:hypothetical protein [Candidatus Babeliales bacterium]
MPIIKEKPKQDKTQIRISIEAKILDTIKQYCDWAGVKKHDVFFEQAAEYLLSKDKEWKHHINQKESV